MGRAVAPRRFVCSEGLSCSHRARVPLIRHRLPRPSRDGVDRTPSLLMAKDSSDRPESRLWLDFKALLRGAASASYRAPVVNRQGRSCLPRRWLVDLGARWRGRRSVGAGLKSSRRTAVLGSEEPDRREGAGTFFDFMAYHDLLHPEHSAGTMRERSSSRVLGPALQALHEGAGI
jgi:hypothetical protein